MEDFEKVWRREQKRRLFVDHCINSLLFVTVLVILAAIVTSWYQYLGGIDTISINDFFMGFFK